MAEAERWSVEKLNGGNWITWKFQMSHVLKAKQLWKIVSGEEIPDPAWNQRALLNFQERKQKAFTTIVMAVEPALLYLVTTTEGPKAAWDALATQFERNTLSNRIFLKKKYFRMEMQEGESLQIHLKNMKELTDQLAAIECEITEEDQVVTLLGSLPRNFDTLVTTLEARTDYLSLTEVQQALIHEDSKMRGVDRSHTDAALMGTHRKSTKKKIGMKCFGCGQLGHFHRDCPINAYKGSKGKQPKIIHSAKFSTQEESSDDECAFTMQRGDTPVNTDQCDEWLIDSGATSRMTWNKAVLRDFHEFQKPQLVGLGDGRPVFAQGCGRVMLKTQLECGSSGSTPMTRVLYVPALKINLFSVKAVTDKGMKVEFKDDLCRIFDSRGHLRGLGTMTRKPFKNVGIRATRKLQLVHSDVCGPMQCESIGGMKYFVTFTDDYSRCVAVYFMRKKSEVLEKFKLFEASTISSCDHKGYRLVDENGKLYKRRDVEFNECEFVFSKTTDFVCQNCDRCEPEVDSKEVMRSEQKKTTPIQTNEQTTTNDNEQKGEVESKEVRRSERKKMKPIRFMFEDQADVSIDAKIEHLAMMSSQILEPSTLKEALSSDQPHP
eukprot:gene3880-4423_t